MSKIVVVFDQDTGGLQILPLEAGGFLVLTEEPLKMASRTEDLANRTWTVVLKLDAMPPSKEGQEFLENPSE